MCCKKKRYVSAGEKKIRAKLVSQKKNSCRQVGCKKNSCTENFLPPLRLCADQFESSTSPPRAFELLKIGLFKFPPLGTKKRFKCPTNWYWTTSRQRQISSSIKHFIRLWERDFRNDTFKLLLKTLLKELITNKGEIISCKSVKPCKTKKLTGVLRQN